MAASHGGRVLRVLAYIHDHPAGDLSLEALADLAAIATDIGDPNVKSFARAFSEAYGSSPAAFRKDRQVLPALPLFKTGGYLMHPIIC